MYFYQVGTHEKTNEISQPQTQVSLFRNLRKPQNLNFII